jgi:hypothetical protein
MQLRNSVARAAICAALSFAPLATVLAIPGAATAGAALSDSTIDLSNYTLTTAFTTGATITASNCVTCGPTAGGALQFQVVLSPNQTADLGLVNNSLLYNPGTEGAITSIDASVDKDFSFQPAESNGFTNGFHPLIEQNNQFYEADIAGASSPSGTVVSTLGYQPLSQSGLTAGSFNLINFGTGVIDDTSHPNFSATGDPLSFGLVQLSSAGSYQGTDTIDYANLDLTISSAPEPSAWALMLLGVFGLGAALRSQRRKAVALAA